MFAFYFALLLLATPQAPATTATASPSTPSTPALQIIVEKKLPDGKAEAMLPTHVFQTGDVLRLRLVSQFDGYLYMMDQGSSGQFSTVFPSVAAGSDNRISRGKTYLVPATEDGWFELSGPPGFDVFYFLLSPSPVSSPATTSFAAPGPTSSLRPRCNDAVFRARGECVDANAGPMAVPRDAPLPAPLAPIAGAASRDITILRKDDSVTVQSGASKTAPVLYTFRLAHN